ncbi:MAG TPA: CNNM domain-containing protein, partial [Acidimicrobiales bacterium]|nr:CNNM domain-containing protein [Acidimicrobiales bacterium]
MTVGRGTSLLAASTAADWWLVVAIVVLLVLAALAAAAEAALTRVTRPRAEDLAAEGRRNGDVLLELVQHASRTVTTVVFLRIVCQLVQATLVGILANRLL